MQVLRRCEAAYHAAEAGAQVVLHEMRPEKRTAAHKSDCLGELVCSNSLNRAGAFGSVAVETGDAAVGLSYNLVGFQNHMRFGDRARVFRLIPGLEKAEFLRFGQMHRNTYINSPALLKATLPALDEAAKRKLRHDKKARHAEEASEGFLHGVHPGMSLEVSC